mgnify:CR=1 FL=1
MIVWVKYDILDVRNFDQILLLEILKKIYGIGGSYQRDLNALFIKQGKEFGCKRVWRVHKQKLDFLNIQNTLFGKMFFKFPDNLD